MCQYKNTEMKEMVSKITKIEFSDRKALERIHIFFQGL